MNLPASMLYLPRTDKDLPVPHCASWSSETWGFVRVDRHAAGLPALFTAGGQGIGRPVLGVLNEPRQRRAVMERRCQVCDRELEDSAFLPAAVLNEAKLEDGTPVTSEPPCCQMCAEWSAANCPGLTLRGSGVIRIRSWRPIAQIIDPSLAPPRKAARFNPVDPAVMRRLGAIARFHGGVVGYIKVAVNKMG